MDISTAPSTWLGPCPCYLGWPSVAVFFSCPLIGTELKVISIPASYRFDLLPALNISSRFALDLLFPYLPSACDILWHFHFCTTPELLSLSTYSLWFIIIIYIFFSTLEHLYEITNFHLQFLPSSYVACCESQGCWTALNVFTFSCCLARRKSPATCL